MNFEPHVPDWGLEYLKKNSENLLLYHNWLRTTGIKSGLISSKEDQFIWDEFIIHSLYFSKLLTELKSDSSTVLDLGTGGGIPGITIGLTTDFLVKLVDIKEKRINELLRLINILKVDNIEAVKKDANSLIVSGGLFVSRCYISSENVLSSLKKNLKNTTYLVSSSGEGLNYDPNVFHVKQEKFYINKTDLRHIDVITVK